MGDPQQPPLPESAPAELRDFVACKRASVTIRNGPLDWLPLPAELSDLPKPDLTLEPGTSAGSATISVGFGIFSLSLPASVTNGELQVDTSGLPDMLGDLKQPLDDWIRNLNDWLKANGQRFAAPTVQGGEVTLVKEPIPAAAPPATAPMPPVTPVPPVTPTEKSDKGGWCGLLGLLLIGVIGIAGLGGAYALGLFGGAGPQPSPSSAAPTTVGVPLTPPLTTAPTSPPTSSAAPPTSLRPSPTTTSGGATQTPAAARTAVPTADLASISATFEQLTGGVLLLPADILAISDAREDLFDPVGGLPRPYEHPWIDLTTAAAYPTMLDVDAAEALSALSCDEPHDANGLIAQVACNQRMPLQPGDYVILTSFWAGLIPDPFPQSAQCSYAVHSDRDHDRKTGFQTDMSANPLIGADVYHQVLFVYDQQGVLRPYLLGTDHALPPRADTGDVFGNLPTTGRAIWTSDDVTAFTFVIPAVEMGDNWSAHAYCLDRSDPFGTATVDAPGDPSQTGYPFYYSVIEGFD